MIPTIAPSASSSSTTLAGPARGQDARPRNRRLVARNTDDGSSLSTPGHLPSRDASPIPAARIGSVTGRNDATNEVAHSRGKSPAAPRGLFDSSSWAPSWASVQGFATSLLGGSDTGSAGGSRDASQTRQPRRQVSYGNVATKSSGGWGPEPPSSRRPRLQDVGAGSMAEREASLRAMRTASVLESHPGVNGGLDFKKRNSDDVPRDSPQQQQEVAEHLVYIHHVQPSDTYAGIVLKYRCREDVFRKANGLWSRDGIQIRKWLVIPIDACEVKGRPCAPPTSETSKFDLLARTPEETYPFGGQPPTDHDDFFSSASNVQSERNPNPGYDEDRPWTHVRWVAIDSCPHPVEIARVPRKALGFFPPRRKKSVHTASTLSTPRQSLDVPSIMHDSDPGVSGLHSPGSTSSRRPSVLSNRPQLGPTVSSASATRTRGNSIGAGSAAGGGDEPKPAWMRRPGGVGSLGRHVRAPGPERDYFNSWTKKHLPSLTMESLPSMSVMGSEVARIGFGKADPNSVAIAESPFEDGQTAGFAATQGAQGTGLDKAAAAVESWLRGAFVKRNGPLTPVLGPRGRGTPGEERGGDLIELETTYSDDGREPQGADLGSLLGQDVFGPTGWSANGAGAVRGRTTAKGSTPGKDSKGG